MRFGQQSELKQLVIDKLKLNWSPEQISGWFSVNLSRRKSMQISHETIYKTLYVRSRKTLDHLLAVHLRRAHKMRHSKHHSRSGDRGTINIVNGVSIHKRPKAVESHREIGHWEGDLVTGSGGITQATHI
jgi:IS30 family transposase